MGVNNRHFSQDVESILWKILNASSELKAMISGGIYKEAFRPTNSNKEDICINTISLTQENPQIGVHNINSYTAALKQKLNGIDESVPNTPKLKALAEKVKQVLDLAVLQEEYKNYSFRITGQRTLKNLDSTNPEYYQNLIVEFIIPQDN